MSYSLVVGTVLLNLACTTVIPSWLNIKRKDVSIHKLVWSVVVGTAFFCITLGVITALGFDLTGNTSVISALFSKGVPPGLARFSAGAFSFILLLPGIPVSFMVARNNLVQNRLVSPRTATFLAIFLPWFICIPLQTGNAIFHVQIWSSLLFSSPVNFIIPFLMYFRCLQFRREFNTKRILTVNQIELLHIIHHLSPPINDFLSSKRMRLLNGRRRPSDQDAPAPAGVAAAEPLRPAVDIPTILIVAPDSQNSADTLEQDQGVTAAISADQAQAPLSVVAADALPEPGHIEEGLAPLSTHLPLRLSTDSYGSRDSKVTLRLDCAETDEDVPFVNPQDAGLPSFIVDEDIPVETPRSAGSHQHPQHADLDFGYQPESPVASLPASPRVHTSHDLPRLSVETPQIVKTSGTGQRADSPYLHVYPMQDGLASMPLVEQARADHAKPTASTRPASPTPFLQVPSSQYLQLEHRPMILTLSIDSHERGRAASRDPSLLRVPGRSQSGSRSQSPTTYSPTRHSPTSNSPSHSPSQSPMFLQVPRLADLHGLHGWHSGSPEPRRVSFDERSFGGDSSTRRSASSCTTGHLSLPYEQEFTAAPFEILPAWFPVSEHTVAVFFVLVTSGICVCNMVMYAVMSLTSQ
nr:hypothetical protein HK105_003216 [Polyrhizophydium stewartii]